MSRSPSWRRYLRFWRSDVGADIDDELRFHFEERIQDLVALGCAPEDARQQALTEFGDLSSVRSDLASIDARIEQQTARHRWWDFFRQDVRHAARSLARAPALTATVVITLALGLGINTATFSLLARLFIETPPGVRDASHLFRLYTSDQLLGTSSEFAREDYSYPELAELGRALAPLALTAAYTRPLPLRSGSANDAQLIFASHVDGDYFATLGVRPVMGRFFSPRETVVQTAVPVAILSYALWQSRFGADPTVLGRTLDLEGSHFTIVGVAPKSFTGVTLDASDIWLPLGTLPLVRGLNAEYWYESGHSLFIQLLVRPRPGVPSGPIENRAVAALRLDPRLAKHKLAVSLGPLIVAAGPQRRPGPGENQRQEISIAGRLAGVAVIVLLIACANIANLFLARAVARRREIAVRMALGISGARLTMLVLSETLLLATAAGAAALLAGWWGARALRVIVLPTVHWSDAPFDWRVLAFTAGATVLAAFATGLAPALHWRRTDVTSVLKGGAREGTFHRSHLRTGLLLAQATLSVLLLVGAGLFVRSLYNVISQHTGYDIDRLVVARIGFEDGDSAAHDAERRRVLPLVAQRATALPGVERVAVASFAPFMGFSIIRLFRDNGDTLAPPTVMLAFNVVSREYFAATGMRVVSGRSFDSTDRAGAPRAVIVNAAMAQRFWPGRSALSQCVRLLHPSNPCYTVVGVAEDARIMQLIEQPFAQYYIPLAQAPDSQNRPSALILRVVSKRRQAVVEDLNRIMRSEFPDGTPHITSVSEVVAPQLRPWRSGATLFSIFATLALIVAGVGVYSTVAYAASQRTHELGVRIALGAGRQRVVRLLLADGMRTVAIGTVIGTGLALAFGRVVASLLYGIEPSDPLTLAVVALVLLTVAAAASFIPAWRSANVDPVAALRVEA